MNETIKYDSTNLIYNPSNFLTNTYLIVEQVELTDECIQKIAERVVELIKDAKTEEVKE